MSDALSAQAATAPRPGRVIWITGLSGAGKTTVGVAVVAGLRAAGTTVLWLDGDRLRAVMGAADRGFDDQSRRGLALSYARLCRELSMQGVDVVCATVSMFDEVRQWSRAHNPRYFEVYLRVPLDELHRRDPKGHYRASQSMVGIHVTAEEPKCPDLVIDNHGDVDAELSARTILTALETWERERHS